MRLIAAAVLLVVLLCSVCCAKNASPEMRVLWVERWNIVDEAECHKMVETAKKCNFNCLVVQVRGKGDTMFPCSTEPLGQEMRNAPAGFDPLAVIVKDAHKAGIQVHAWLNANYAWGSNTPPLSPEHIVNSHPYWLMRYKTGEVKMASTPSYDGCFACPGHRAYVQHLANVYVEVAKKYDVDGICFDFIRYPNYDFCYCDWCLTRFRAEMDRKITAQQREAVSKDADRMAYVKAFPEQWSDFRRGLITSELYRIHDAIKAVKPGIAVSASVFPGSNAYEDRLQDWKRWLADGKLDLLFPMLYVKSTDTFVKNVKEAMDASHGQPICPNIGSYLIPVDSTIEKIAKARELGAIGSGVYCWAITNEGQDTSYLQTVCDKIWSRPASVPAISATATEAD